MYIVVEKNFHKQLIANRFILREQFVKQMCVGALALQPTNNPSKSDINIERERDFLTARIFFSYNNIMKSKGEKAHTLHTTQLLDKVTHINGKVCIQQ